METVGQIIMGLASGYLIAHGLIRVAAWVKAWRRCRRPVAQAVCPPPGQPLSDEQAARAYAAFILRITWLSPRDLGEAVNLAPVISRMAQQRVLQIVEQRGADDPVELVTVALALALYCRELSSDSATISAKAT